MKSTSTLICLLLAVGPATRSPAHEVAVGLPPDHAPPGVLNPGIGEATVAEVVARMGQTFTVPSGHPLLTSVSFWLGDSPFFEPQPTTFQAVLMEYGADRPVGPVLHQGPAVTTAGLLHGESRRFDFAVVAALTPGASYVVFLDVTAYADGVPNFATFSSLADADFYPGGTLVYSSPSVDLDHVADAAWQHGFGWDVAFRATFRGIPEPSGLVLLGSALCGAILRRRRALLIADC